MNYINRSIFMGILLIVLNMTALVINVIAKNYILLPINGIAVIIGIMSFHNG